MSNTYLDIAATIIREEGRPLHPKEILKLARDKGLTPPHLYGKTQHKTLTARLSTDIRHRGQSSPFFRTAANTFFLRELNEDKFEEYRAPRRQKTLHNEQILTIKENFLSEINAKGIITNIREVLELAKRGNHFSYLKRKKAEETFDFKQVITYAIIYRSDRILSYRRGKYSSASNEIKGLKSIGFGGHISDHDSNLFDSDGYGILENARRELSEELVFDNFEINNLQDSKAIRILCGLNTYESVEARKHIAVTITYHCTPHFTPEKNELSINELRWMDIRERENNLDAFEPWSRIILESLYTGRLRIAE